MGGHQVGYGRMEYFRRKTGLPLHVKMEKLDFTCQVLGKCACGNGKDTNLHANKGNKHAKQKISKSTCQRKKEWTRKMRKTRNCVSGKRGADTQKRENEKLRVEKKRRRTRKKRKTVKSFFVCKLPLGAKRRYAANSFSCSSAISLS